MFKKSVSQIKKVLPVLLAVFFVVSLTAVSASAYYGGHGFRYGWGYNYPFGPYPPIASVGVASPVVMTEAAVPAMTTMAVPTVTTATVEASPVVVASEPGILGAPIVTGLGYGFGYGPGYGYGLGYGGWGHGHYGGCHHR
jgi:hypothetical protein